MGTVVKDPDPPDLSAAFAQGNVRNAVGHRAGCEGKEQSHQERGVKRQRIPQGTAMGQ